MEAVIRALIVYIVLLVVFRLAGKRTLSQASEFELVLLLIISETVQEALVAGDHSMTHAFLLVTTLVAASVVLSLVKRRWKAASRVLEGLPFVIVCNGEQLKDHMRRARVDEDDILAAGRRMHGIERMDQIKYAVVENSGEISVIPRRSEG